MLVKYLPTQDNKFRSSNWVKSHEKRTKEKWRVIVPCEKFRMKNDAKREKERLINSGKCEIVIEKKVVLATECGGRYETGKLQQAT